MPTKTVPISVRLTPNDAEFIAQMNVEGASTPSDKLRAIIVDARRRKLGTQDYSSSLKLTQDMAAPTLRIIRASEHTHRLHSELISRLGDWLPECLAYLIASNGADTELDEKHLEDIEQGLAQRVFVLMQSVLQMAVTKRGPVYNPEVVHDGVQPVLDLAEVILNKH